MEKWWISLSGAKIQLCIFHTLLSPSDVVHVDIHEEEHSALVIVPDNQLSLSDWKKRSKCPFGSPINRMEDRYQVSQ